MLKDQEYSPSQVRINQLKKLKEDKEKGIFSGIPMWETFTSLSDEIPTIDKGQVILNAAFSGAGKSMITRFKDIFVPWMFVRKHPEYEIDLKFVIFLLEDDIDRFKDYLISFLLFMKFGLRISPKRLRSSFKEPLPDDIFQKIEQVRPAMDDLLSKCIIEDTTYNTYGIYKKCRMLSEEWGEHFYTDMISGSVVITKEQYNNLKELPEKLRDISLNELKNKEGLNPLEYRSFYKYSHYVPNNPKQHVILVIDNINCLVPDKNEGDLKFAMDNLMYNYLRKNIAKHWQWTCVAVQQNVGGAEEKAFTFRGESVIEKLEPNLSQLGDSKLTQRACHLIYGLFDPHRYGIDTYMDYNISQLKDQVRFLFVLKNNDGKSNLITPLYFEGASSYFKELPLPTSMVKDGRNIYKEVKEGKFK